LLLIVFVRRHGKLRFGEIGASLTRIAAAALAMGLFCWGAAEWLGLAAMPNGWTKIGLTLGTIAAAVLVFAAIGRLLRVRESAELISMFRRRNAERE